MSDLLSEMLFTDLECAKIPVTIGKSKYIMTEASVAAVNKFKSKSLEGMKFENGKPVNITGVGDAETLLLSQCLYNADENGQLRMTKPVNDSSQEPDRRYLVPLQRIQNWPNQIQEKLVARLKSISNLGEEENEATLTKQMDEIVKKLQVLREAKKSSNGVLIQDTPTKNE